MKIDFTKLTGKLLEYAALADKESGLTQGIYPDNETEISLFIRKAQKNGVSEDDINAIFGLKKQVRNPQKIASEDEQAKATYIEKLTSPEKTDVTYNTRMNSEEELYQLTYELDSFLIQNEVTGLGAILNRLPKYDLNELAEKYLSIQTKFNKVEFDVENWFKNPASEIINIDAKTIFEENSLEQLGMPYEEFAVKYASELKDVAKLTPVNDKSSWGQQEIHRQEVAKLSDSAKEVYTKISKLNKVLATNFNAWENDIRHKANDKSAEMSMNVIEDLSVVESNEYANENTFEMPKNWLVKKNFIKTIKDISGDFDENPDKIHSTTIPKTLKTKKIVKNNKILIVVPQKDGTKKYFDTLGNEIQ